MYLVQVYKHYIQYIHAFTNVCIICKLFPKTLNVKRFLLDSKIKKKRKKRKK